ncbi:hypothetical protein MJD09_09620, partial [bacterium]|nr:hypothetical protein [bacterium]
MQKCRKGTQLSVIPIVGLIIALNFDPGVAQSWNFVVPGKKALDDKSSDYNPKRVAKSTVDFRPFRRAGIHDGNLIRTAFSNFGNLGSRVIDVR